MSVYRGIHQRYIRVDKEIYGYMRVYRGFVIESFIYLSLSTIKF